MLCYPPFRLCHRFKLTDNLVNLQTSHYTKFKFDTSKMKNDKKDFLKLLVLLLHSLMIINHTSMRKIYGVMATAHPCGTSGRQHCHYSFLG